MKKTCNFYTSKHCERFWAALIFAGSGQLSSWVTKCCNNLTCQAGKWHFFWFNLRPGRERVAKTAEIRRDYVKNIRKNNFVVQVAVIYSRFCPLQNQIAHSLSRRRGITKSNWPSFSPYNPSRVIKRVRLRSHSATGIRQKQYHNWSAVVTLAPWRMSRGAILHRQQKDWETRPSVRIARFFKLACHTPEKALETQASSPDKVP